MTTTQTLRLLRSGLEMSDPLPLIEAAKAACALSGWANAADGKPVFVASAIAMQALRQAIDATENPTLRLAPEPLPRTL